MTKFKRNVLSEDSTKTVSKTLQQRLVDLVDLALQLKQAHWCVVGNNFRSVHLHLDEIILDVRAASDEVAERMATLGVAPDGRSSVVAKQTSLDDLSDGFADVPATVSAVADRLQQTISGLRDSIGILGDVDPISEDMLIAISGPLEKHLWMVQSQEV